MTDTPTTGIAKLRRERLARRHEKEKALAFKKAEIYEQALADVWRWTNDGYPHLELLLPVLRAADADASLAKALDDLEKGLMK